MLLASLTANAAELEANVRTLSSERLGLKLRHPADWKTALPSDFADDVQETQRGRHATQNPRAPSNPCSLPPLRLRRFPANDWMPMTIFWMAALLCTTSSGPLVTGRVLHADGGVVADAGVIYRIEFEGRGSIHTGTRTGLDGGFAIPWPRLTERPDDGEPYERPAKSGEISAVRLHAAVGPRMSPEARVKGGDVTLWLREPAQLTVRLKGAASNKPATLVSSVLWPPPSADEVSAAFFDRREVISGAQFPAVPAGTALVHASQGNLIGIGRAELAPGGAATIDVALARSAALTVTVFDAFTEKRADFYVEISVEPGAGNPTEIASKGGIGPGESFDLPSAVASEHVITLTDQYRTFESVHRVRLRPGEKRTVALPFVPKLDAGTTGIVAVEAEGAFITLVAPGSPAARAGVQSGEPLLEVDEVKPGSAEHAARLLKGPPGSKVAVRLGASAAFESAERTVVIRRTR